MIAAKKGASIKSLTILDRWLNGHEFLTEAGYTIADISVFAYVSRAGEAGMALTGYPAVSTWVDRVKTQENFLDSVYPYSIDSHSGAELP
jgi:glutathione S-transferase